MKQVFACLATVAGLVFLASYVENLPNPNGGAAELSAEGYMTPVECTLPGGNGERIEEYLQNALPEQNDLVPQVYGENVLLNVGHTGNGEIVLFEMDYSRTNANAHIHALDDILNRYPTKNIRSVAIDGAEQTYLVYMTGEGTWLYLFFKDNTLAGYPILMKKALSYSDFSELSVGDPIEAVERIDPIENLYHKQYDLRADSGLRGDMNDITLTTNHILTDGFLQIQYDRDKTRRYTVRSIEFHGDFTATNIPTSYPAYITADQLGSGFTHLYKILPKDYAIG